MLPLKFRVTGPSVHDWTGNYITGSGVSLKILSWDNRTLEISMNAELSINKHLDIVKQALPDCSVSFSSEEVAKTTVKAGSIPIWDTLFKKPAPVFENKVWADSDKSRQFIYLPNCTKYEGSKAEDCNSNSMYTVVLLHSYQDMCRIAQINPDVLLRSGVKTSVLSLNTSHGLNNLSTDGERAAGLANSELVSFKDATYYGLFLKCISQLHSSKYGSEQAKTTVLAKSEFILSGRSAHIYNQRFIKIFFTSIEEEHTETLLELFGEDASNCKGRLFNIIRAMVVDGLVLEKSVNTFQSRVYAAGMEEGVEFLTEVFKNVTKE